MKHENSNENIHSFSKIDIRQLSLFSSEIDDSNLQISSLPKVLKILQLPRSTTLNFAVCPKYEIILKTVTRHLICTRNIFTLKKKNRPYVKFSSAIINAKKPLLPSLYHC